MKTFLDAVPRTLASKGHIILLLGMLLWLIPLGLAFPGIAPDRLQLIAGNYCNVTSDLGACIAAGGTLANLVKSKQTHQLLTDVHALVGSITEAPTPAPKDPPQVAP